MKLKLRLTIDVDFDIDDEDCAQLEIRPESVAANLKHNLAEIPEWLSGEGQFTHSYPATVDQYTSKVETL